MKVLVTGGAGYIGSHVVRALIARGDDVLVMDNLSHGHREAVGEAQFVEIDLADTEGVYSEMSAFKPDGVMHFAAFIEVGESMKEPLKYYRNNVANALSLLGAMRRCGISTFIFSSSAAVYGIPAESPIRETCPIAPINPYGASKAFVERILGDLSVSSDFRYVALRYFNAAGADPSCEIGESHHPESHLIPLILAAASGERTGIRIFGTDYPTPDGTCIRDYVHVSDLADAHLLALDYLISGGLSEVFNCGYGNGYSVREVVDTVRLVTGKEFNVEEVDRRLGDPAELVAESGKLKRTLSWTPRYNDLTGIVETAWHWHLNRRY